MKCSVCGEGTMAPAGKGLRCDQCNSFVAVSKKGRAAMEGRPADPAPEPKKNPVPVGGNERDRTERTEPARVERRDDDDDWGAGLKW